MRNTITIGAALLIVSSTANAITNEQKGAMTAIAMASLAGGGDRCPRYTLIKSALSAEAHASRLGDLDDSREKIDVWRKIDDEILRDYNDDPSRFCATAWARLGPNGTYRRQLLEQQ